MNKTSHSALHSLCHAIGLCLVLLLAACGGKPSIPSSYAETQEAANIYPALDCAVVPPNIAPLNFMLMGDATGVVARLGDLIAESDGKDVNFDIDEWHALLSAKAGETLPLDIWTQCDGAWRHHPTQHITVAREEIDSFLVYRLIEPGYELYRQLGIYERDLTSFAERPVVENNRQWDSLNNHCLNCHNFQAWDSRRFLFHIRAAHGGTMIADADATPRLRKVDMRCDSILAAGVYPSWHPTANLVALSTNKTGQTFHMFHQERIEVLDYASDLILYDPENNSVTNVLRSSDQLETFPCWNADGTRLYYCSAAMPTSLLDTPDSLMAGNIAALYDSLIYNVYSMSFDVQTRSFGESRVEVQDGHSVSFPRISPDGRWLLYARGDYGQFHIWHNSADLWVKDLQRDSCYALTEANSDVADSYHAWSSNGRWIAFASRRDDGNFSRVFISYFDANGRAHRPFMLPQQRADHNILLLKSYNVPELVQHHIPCTQAELQEAVLTLDAQKSSYQ